MIGRRVVMGLWRMRSVALFFLYAAACVLLAQRDTDVHTQLTIVHVLVFYRLPILGTAMVWLWSVNISLCARWGISVQELFHLRGTDSGIARNVAQVASVFTILVAWAVILRVNGASYVTGPLRPYFLAVVHPVGLHAVAFGLLFCPLRVFFAEERWAVCRSIGRMFVAPFSVVNFSDIIFVDALTSMSRGLTALEVLYCVSSSPVPADRAELTLHCSSSLLVVLACCPYWFRLMQCLRKYRDADAAFPDLANAAKYSTAFPLILIDKVGPALIARNVITVSTQHSLWFACALFNSSYCFLWDASMDWGLAPEMSMSLVAGTASGLLACLWFGIDRFAALGFAIGLSGACSVLFSNKICRWSGGKLRRKAEVGSTSARDMLRDDTIFPTAIYGCALCANLMLRMAWVLRLAPLPVWFPPPAITALLLEILELLRRFMWIFLRLEWEKHATSV